MELELKRFSNGVESTLGNMIINNSWECFSLEDEFRAVKVQGETRIPAGRYEVKFREVLSGLTKKYQDRYPWFKYHLHIQDVPGFNYVYLHIGNTDDHTDGCILLGDSATTNKHGNEGSIGSSRIAFKRFYEKVCAALNTGESVHINITN